MLKNKYDGMKKDWRLWKFLKRGETGLGWDPTTWKISADAEWWDMKIKEQPLCKKFRHKGISPDLEDLWDLLYGDNTATGEHCVAPSMDTSHATGIQTTEEQEYDCDLGSMDNGSFLNLLNNLTPGGTQQPTSHQEALEPPPTQSMAHPLNPPRSKRKRRQSTGSSMMQEHLATVMTNSARVLDLYEAEAVLTNNEKSSSTVCDGLSVLARMVNSGIVISKSPLWCFAISSIKDADVREMFLKLENDPERMAWLEWEFANREI